MTPDTIRRHLEGETTIGLYAINPATQRSKSVAIDADYKDSLAPSRGWTETDFMSLDRRNKIG